MRGQFEYGLGGTLSELRGGEAVVEEVRGEVIGRALGGKVDFLLSIQRLGGLMLRHSLSGLLLMLLFIP